MSYRNSFFFLANKVVGYVIFGEKSIFIHRWGFGLSWWNTRLPIGWANWCCMVRAWNFPGIFDDIGRLGRCLEELFPWIFLTLFCERECRKWHVSYIVPCYTVPYLLTTMATVCFMHLMHGLVLTIGGHKLPDNKEPSTIAPGASALGIIQYFQATVSVFNEFVLWKSYLEWKFSRELAWNTERETRKRRKGKNSNKTQPPSKRSNSNSTYQDR